MIKVRGLIEIKHGETLIQRISNLVVTSGLNQIAAIVETSSARPSHIAVGTNGALATLGQVALQGTEIQRKVATISRIDSTITYDVVFGPGLVGGPFTIQELGLFNNAVGGIMIGRSVSAPWGLTAASSINVSWSLTFR